MILYHEIRINALDQTLRIGLKRTKRGEKGDNLAIVKTDMYLDEHLPPKLRWAGLSRDNNIYAYIGDQDTIIDIQDGAVVPLKKYVGSNETALLKLNVNPESCYVADLDKYDEIKKQIDSGDASILRKLVKEYWESVTPLVAFRRHTMARPEVMIVEDISATDLQLV